MNWVLVLWYLAGSGISATNIDGLSEKGCKSQALKFIESKVPIIAVCVEKR